jgi:hypothetical protein
VEKMNPLNFELRDDEMMDSNPIQRDDGMKPQLFQRKMMVQSVNEVTYRLDSLVIVYPNSYKSQGYYDNNGNQTLYIYSNWNDDSQSFVPSQKEEYTYDNDGNQILKIVYYWNDDSQSLVPSFKQEHTYDENGNFTLFIQYNWNTETQSFDFNYGVGVIEYYDDGKTKIEYDYQFKIEYTYDNDGNQILKIVYVWNTESQSFVPSQKEEYTYDNDGNQILKIVYIWNTESQSFVPSQKEEYTNDNDGNQILKIEYIWNTESQSFVLSQKEEYTYDNDGNQILKIVYIWNTESQSFVPSQKEEYTNDNDGNQILKIEYIWNTESQSFVLSQKEEYTYNEFQTYPNVKGFRWDNVSQSFILTRMGEILYYSNGVEKRNENMVINFTYVNGEIIFYNGQRRIEEFDLNGNIILSQLELWDDEKQQFYIRIKYEYTYDENGNKTLYIGYRQIPTTTSHEPINKIEYSYNSDNLKINETSYSWYSGLEMFKPYIKMDISTLSETETNLVREGIRYEYDTNFNTWNELEGEEFKSYWYYTKTPSLSTNSVESNSFSIYPNPTSNSLHINSSESLSNPIFELYDVKGSKILSNPFKLTEPIDVSDLQPSMYIYNVKDGSEVKQSGKVLIE